jgi:hypothetical protein
MISAIYPTRIHETLHVPSFSSHSCFELAAAYSAEKDHHGFRNFPHHNIMDPAGKEISMDAAIKMMNDQAHYEVRRNICLAVLLYFGMFMAYHG